MGRFIHTVIDDDGIVSYREWSTIVDAYITAPMTRAEMHERLTDDARAAFNRACDEVVFRLDRAAADGTSCYDEQRDRTAWDTEVCRGCGRFHHAWEPGLVTPGWPRVAAEPQCTVCGEVEGDPAHLDPCGVLGER